MSKVYFIKDTTRAAELFDIAGFKDSFKPKESAALKIHFGEPGNQAYLKPQIVKPLALKVKECGSEPFYTDCNVLYKGPRDNSKDHYQVAREHGYTEENAGAPVILSDDPDGKGSTAVEVNLKHFRKVFLGPKALEADSLLVLTHFKGHEQTGFGGALKNIGMGLGTRRGKLQMHSDCKRCPEVKTCRKYKDLEACWFGSPKLIQEKIVEYCAGVLKNKKGKTGYITFITNVSPQCDCYDFNDPPIVPDIGVLASTDPVSIDQASVDLINKTPGRIKGSDKFKALYPKVDWGIQLNYAEKAGLGTRVYELISL